ncbi:MAG: hypothetical protein HPY85_12300 [Anaerolineae bacterium]|nr:hypothetical protein [Anaerolineae bacterium]
MRDNDLIYEYFYQNIVSPYDELQKKKKNIPLGENKFKYECVNLCFQLYHFKEKLATKYQSKYSLEYLKARCSDFGYIRDIANISKHHKWDSIKNPNPHIASEEDISEVLEIIDLKDDFGVYKVPRIVVRIQTVENDILYISNLIGNAINMWLDILEELGYVSNPKHVELLTFIPPDRENKNFYHTGTVSGVRGQNWNFQFSFLLYDYSSGKLVQKQFDDSMNWQFLLNNPSNPNTEVETVFHTSEKGWVQVTFTLDYATFEEFDSMRDNDKKIKYLLQYHQDKITNMAEIDEPPGL